MLLMTYCALKSDDNDDSDFFANFHLTLALALALLLPKDWKTNIEKITIKEGIKLKTVVGVFVRDIIRLNIFVFHECCGISFQNFCDKHPLLAKKRF